MNKHKLFIIVADTKERFQRSFHTLPQQQCQRFPSPNISQHSLYI